MIDIFKRTRQERLVKKNIKKYMKEKGFTTISRKPGIICTYNEWFKVPVRYGPGLLYLPCDELRNSTKILKLGSINDPLNKEEWYIIAYGYKYKRHGFVSGRFVI